MVRVLYVEDEALVREELTAAMVADGHQVCAVTTFAEGIAAIATRAHDALVTDIRLPDGSGYVLAERAQAAGMTNILVTGFPEELPIAALTRRFQLIKPFEPAALLAILRGMSACVPAAKTSPKPKRPKRR